jgi:hypothetical protein
VETGEGLRGVRAHAGQMRHLTARVAVIQRIRNRIRPVLIVVLSHETDST